MLSEAAGTQLGAEGYTRGQQHGVCSAVPPGGRQGNVLTPSRCLQQAVQVAGFQKWQVAGEVESRGIPLEEILQIVKGLGSGQPLDFRGQHFDLEGVSMEPRPVQAGGVPLLLACHWRAQRDVQFQRAARLGDGLISISDTPEEYAQVVKRVRAIAAELGRDPVRLETVFYMTVNVDPDLGKAESEANRYLTGYYGANIWGSRWGPFGGPERAKERMAEYAAAGAETLVIRFASFDPERQLDIFLDQVAPAFQ